MGEKASEISISDTVASLKMGLFQPSHLSNNSAGYGILGWKETLLHQHFEEMHCYTISSTGVAKCDDGFKYLLKKSLSGKFLGSEIL